MNRLSWRRAAVLLGALALGVVVPSGATAQGTMTFGEDEAKDVQDEGDSDDGQEKSQGMTFDTETDVEGKKSGSSKPLVGLVAVPSDAITSSQRQRIKDRLVTSMKRVPDIELAPGTSVLQALRKRTISSCVTEPLCLGSVGGEAGVDRIVMARVDKEGGTYQLDLDYFNVSDRLFIEYKSVQDLGGVEAVVAQIEPTVEEIFGLEKPQQQQTYARRDNSRALQIIAWTSTGLSAAALGTGIVFGVQASGLESDLKDKRQPNGRYSSTQSAAQQKLNNAQSKAALATGFYITSGVLAVAGGVLFVVSSTGGPEKPPSTGKQADRSWRITPTAGRDSLGLEAAFRF